MNQDDFNEAERRSKLRMQVIYEGAKKPKREWVGLTDQEIYETWDFIIEDERQAIEFARTIEAALKEKNK
tara:strand:+ start:139 stop:348 length:210 start_codon:yes stop_codon:yes gene_type:complete